jgi:hypothetical protein
VEENEITQQLVARFAKETVLKTKNRLKFMKATQPIAKQME